VISQLRISQKYGEKWGVYVEKKIILKEKNYKIILMVCTVK
jgi:hypothetical protein